MRRLLFIIILALSLAGSASAQWADPGGTKTAQMYNYVATELPAAVTSSGPAARPPIPDNPVPETTPRANVPCGYAHACDDGSSVRVVPRPDVPPLVDLTTGLTLGEHAPVEAPVYFCYITFNAKVPGFVTGDQIRLGSRPQGSTGVFQTAFIINTATGTASLTVSANLVAGKEWQATETATGEKSAVVTITNALPISCA